MMHLSSVIPANDTRERVIGHRNYMGKGGRKKHPPILYLASFLGFLLFHCNLWTFVENGLEDQGHTIFGLYVMYVCVGMQQTLVLP